MIDSRLDGEIRDGRHYLPVRIYYEDTDCAGIVYHASFIRFMERGRTNYLRLLGADQRGLVEAIESEAPGFGFVVRFVVEARIGRVDHPEPRFPIVVCHIVRIVGIERPFRTSYFVQK